MTNWIGSAVASALATLELRTLTHKKQKMWPHGRRAGWMQVCRQMGHSSGAAVSSAEVGGAKRQK